jgi:hypothetical protein
MNHFAMTHPGVPGVVISIPDHKEVGRQLLRTELRKAGIDPADYRKRYDRL